MKLFRIIVSLVLAVTMLTATVSAFSIEADYKDVPPKHWAYEYVMRLGREGIMHGMVEGEYFNKNGEVRSKELLAVLHRMTGEEAYEELVPIENVKDSWYKDAVLWAVNNSVAMFGFTHYSYEPTSGMFSGFWGEGETYDMYLYTIEKPDATPGAIRFELGTNGAETVVTRSDVLVAFYRYAEKVLGKEVIGKGSIEDYADSKKFPDGNNTREGVYKLYYNAFAMYYNGWTDITDCYGLFALTHIWLWAIDAGIIEGYPDGTLRPDATITRAEFAAMLTRFMDYVK